jgi:hypothetical protein
LDVLGNGGVFRYRRSEHTSNDRKNRLSRLSKSQEPPVWVY